MHGREGEVRKRTRYMWPVRTRGTKTVLADHFSSPSTANSFCKDGRTICVGDCALFKPPEDSPPFIGFIRCLSSGEDTSATLGVNWLYRPAELELGKGILLGAAPNEVFYSFHSDEIPAASLLHPCKVAFLPKGIELPPGISAFVCRRVYDIANKRLWWLTDQNFVNERQEEIDKLLHKTKKEMHGMVQPDGRSPKAMSGPTSTTQLKSGSDNAQNTGSSFGPQVKGKKRERVDQGFEPVKRERTSKGDADFVQFTTERVLKSEIVKITDRGGLVDMEGVEKLVQLMTPEKSDRKIDLACRSLLAGVIAVSDNFDCLSRFVQLRGLPVLDEWLQEVHKGKIDGSSPKDNDKSVEEFLFILLRALDKLPVNLNALQTCNIGKSVNHLRTHKDLDIQKKARSLVDKWKKRVEAEMNSHDAKSGSGQAVPWSARSRHGEVSHGGNRNMGGPSEATMKSSITQVSALRNVSVKPSQGEALKSASASPRPAKPVASSASESTNSKDGQPRIAGACGASEPLQTTGRDEKSSSSSQSHNNSQSCSSDQNKLVGLQGKEDARSSTAVSMSVNKLVSGASRHRKTVNGYQGHTASGVQRESGSNRSSLHKNASEKLSQSGLTCEKNSDAPVAEGSCHKLIVKIPNRGRSPILSSGGGTLEDPSVMNSRASSPVMSDKHEPFDRNLKEKSDSSRANITSDVKTESWQSNDFKDVLTGSEGDGSPAVVPGEDRSRTAGGDRKLADLPRAASSSSGNEAKPGKLHEPSFSSINALAESCVKYSEADASVSVGDDVGMNLLASVAAGEMLKSDVVLQTETQVQGSNLHSDSCTANDTNPKASSRHDLAQGNTQNNNGADDDIKRQEITVSGSWHKDGLRRSLSKHASTSSGDGKTVCSCGERFDKQNEHNAFCPCRQGNYKPDDKITSAAGSAAVPAAFFMEKSSSGGEGQHSHETKAVPTGVNGDSTPEFQLNASYSDEKGNVLYTNGEKKKLLSSYSVLKVEGDVKNTVKEEMNQGTIREQKTASALTNSEPPKSTSEGVSPPSTSGKDLASEKLERKDDCADDMRSRSHVNQVGNHKKEQESNASPTHKDSAVADNGLERREENKENKKYLEHRHGGSAGTEVEEKEECASTTADSSPTSVPGASDTDTKLEFDLNEGYNVDDGKYAEPINLVPPGCSASVNLVSPLPFPLSSVSGGLPASITVAAAAKGPFLPPDNLLRCKGKLGWKGSAATSAFRPAEPRKVLEMPLGSSGATLSDAASGKQGRRPLDFDLNVPDERVFEEMACRNFAEDTGSTVDTSNYHDLAHNSAPGRPSGGLDFDLNRVDEAMDVGQCSTSNGHRLQAPILCTKSSASGGFPNGEVSFRGNFDLNNGPGTDEMNVEPSPYSQRMRSNIHTQTPVACVRMNNAEMGNFSSWFPPGNTYSAVTIPSILPDRGEQSFPIVATGGPPRILSSHIGGSPLAPDAYRGQVLSSSPAASFPSAPFQYPVFPFGTSFPLPSATFSVNSTTYMDSSSGGRLCFPAIHSQLLGPASAVSSQFPRPYMISLPDGVNNGALDSNKKWGKQGLDLNAGPGGPEMEGRDETLPLAPGQLSLTGSQALAEEQARMYHMTSGILKRKDPEGGWDSERFSYKQSSWQ